ncbi:MAG: CBS domain-containing protein [Acidimicrobiia bacterium]|nr:CBS domain-containing protein [Acidimicrobiia bacterium]
MDRPSSESRTPNPDRLRRLALRVFLVSIAVNAALGIWALLTDEFGQTEGKVLVTSLLVSAAMLSVLVNAAPLQRRAVWPVPAVAAASAVGSIGLFIVLLWAEIDHEVPLKLAASGLVVAAAATLVSLIALLPLRPDHRPVRWLHGGLVGLLTATVLWGIWAELDSSWYGRTVGVESVLVAALTVAIPVLGRFGMQPIERRRPVRRVTSTAADGGGLSRLAVGQAATASPISIEPAASVRTLIDRLVAADGNFAVVESSGGVEGVIRAGDVLRLVHDRADLDHVTAAEVMSTDPATIAADATIDEAARAMIDNHLGHLLVVGDGRAVVSVHDVLAALATSR